MQGFPLPSSEEDVGADWVQVGLGQIVITF